MQGLRVSTDRTRDTIEVDDDARERCASHSGSRARMSRDCASHSSPQHSGSARVFFGSRALDVTWMRTGGRPAGAHAATHLTRHYTSLFLFLRRSLFFSFAFRSPLLAVACRHASPPVIGLTSFAASHRGTPPRQRSSSSLSLSAAVATGGAADLFVPVPPTAAATCAAGFGALICFRGSPSVISSFARSRRY